jgi:hypothetical protein
MGGWGERRDWCRGLVGRGVERWADRAYEVTSKGKIFRRGARKSLRF